MVPISCDPHFRSDAATVQILHQKPDGPEFQVTPKDLSDRLCFRLIHDETSINHVVADRRRYRYYVSRNLINGTPDSGRSGLRLPASEIERTVAAAACTMLGDEAEIANAALAIGLARNPHSSGHLSRFLSSLHFAIPKSLDWDRGETVHNLLTGEVLNFPTRMSDLGRSRPESNKFVTVSAR